MCESILRWGGIVSLMRPTAGFSDLSIGSGFPAAGGPAGEDESSAVDGKANLLGLHSARKSSQLRGEHVGQHCRGKSGGIRIHQEEQWPVA